MYQSKKYLGHEGVIYPSRVSTKSLLPSIFELKLFFYEQYCITISVLRSIQYPTGLNITNSKTKIIPDHVITVQHYTSYPSSTTLSGFLLLRTAHAQDMDTPVKIDQDFLFSSFNIQVST